jgi:hypothetical protein
MDKANRNDPCPCGSGKKYKKCCGVKELERQKRRAEGLKGSKIVPRGSHGTSSVSQVLAQKVFKILTTPEQPSPKGEAEEALKGFHSLEELIGVEEGQKETSSV